MPPAIVDVDYCMGESH